MSSLPGVKHLCVHPPVCMCDIYVPLRKWECAGESGRFDTRRGGRIFGSGWNCSVGAGSPVKVRRWGKNKGGLGHAQPRGQLLCYGTGVEVRAQVENAETEQIAVCISLNVQTENKSRPTHSLVVPSLACSPVAKQSGGHHSGAEESAPTFHLYSRS